MKITIDTKLDSRDDIIKAIDFLQNVVQSNNISSVNVSRKSKKICTSQNIFENQVKPQAQQSSYVDLFGNSSGTTSEPKQAESQAQAYSSFGNMFDTPVTPTISNDPNVSKYDDYGVNDNIFNGNNSVGNIDDDGDNDDSPHKIEILKY